MANYGKPVGFNWNELCLDAMRDLMSDMPEDGGRHVWVADELYGHYARLPDGVKVKVALEDYARGYESNLGDEVTVCWKLFDGPDEVTAGSYTFTAVR